MESKIIKNWGHFILLNWKMSHTSLIFFGGGNLFSFFNHAENFIVLVSMATPGYFLPVGLFVLFDRFSLRKPG